MSTYEYIIESEDFYCKYAKGKPSVLGREFHDYDEIVMFLGDEAKFVSKNTQTTLTPNDIVWIAREQFHQFIITKTESYTRCIVAIKRGSPLSHIFALSTQNLVSISNANDVFLNIFNNIIKTLTGPLEKNEKTMLLGALITQLIFEKKQTPNISNKNFVEPSSIISRAISYIDLNLSSNLTVKNIANNLNVSQSTLSHKFHEELNISVYQYISKKRISIARQYILSGYSLNAAALLSGFNDYGSFFRICKSHYGIKPSDLVSLHINL